MKMRGLRLLQNGAELYLRERHARGGDGEHQRVGEPVHGGEEGRDVDDDEDELGPRVQAVDYGVAREELTEGDVLQHPVSPLLSASSSRSRASTV